MSLEQNAKTSVCTVVGMLRLRKRVWAFIAVSCLALAFLVGANVVPDQTYASFKAIADWAQIVTTRDSYSFLARTDSAPTAPTNDLLAPPFELRKSNAARKLYTDLEGYAVFAAWLEYQQLVDATVERESLTNADPSIRCFRGELRRQYADALTSFAINYAENWRFNLRYLDSQPRIAARRVTRNITTVVAFSPVGFNHDRTVAILYATFWCGPLCARATYYILEKHNGEWGNVKEVRMCGWIS